MKVVYLVPKLLPFAIVLMYGRRIKIIQWLRP